MLSKYAIFYQVIRLGSFTKAANYLGYTQSAVSQAIKGLERDMGTTLIFRKKEGVSLTEDGKTLFPYIETIYKDEMALDERIQSLNNLENSTITVGTFTSVSKNVLTPLMAKFKKKHPSVSFVLRQGEYTSIYEMIQKQEVDFGFINIDAVPSLGREVLYQDDMLAVLPEDHPLAQKKEVTLEEVANEEFILLDEGEYSVTMHALKEKGLSPQLTFEIYDDYTILTMVNQKLGISLMYRSVLTDYENGGFITDGYWKGVVCRPVTDPPTRTIAIAWKNWDTLPLASKTFADFITRKVRESTDAMGRLNGNLLHT